ncbi:MAG TPA: hypothetical protein VN428_22590 [Bryobacteraceae bacterium]|nr:hypothetical protein [Bryobacteraceae bacterium]
MPVPVTIEEMQGRTFSFYPPIRNFEHNQWHLLRAEWSEVLVVNSKTGQEVWIPRRLFGKISSVDEPVVIVGLERELEYKGGSVWQYERRLVEMPRVMPPRTEVAPEQPRRESSHSVSSQPSTETRISRLIAGVLIGGIALCLVILAIYKAGTMRPVTFTAADQEFLSLSRDDNYFAVVRKLGEPTESRWKAESGELQYRLLWYPQRAYFIILMGTDRNDARYIGALDRNWRVIHYIDLPNGATTASMLRSLEKF